MKKLTRVKLINWHRFTNDIIEFENSTLISGENGAGKSTLLDAIQFVVTCTANYFNKAAHENGKRKLTGYIRCKTGRENKPYERTGEISAHVALEFYEEKKDRYFIVGAVVDSASEGQEKTVRYLIDNMRLDDTLFFLGKTPKSINQFRTTNTKVIRQWCTTEKEAKSMMKNRFGRIEDKFFRLIPKALAFRPIDILVEPENFDIALGTYDRLRKEKRAYGVGLINTQKLDEYDVAPEGSLATVVTSKNKYAKRYINMILGKVVMCDNYQDLKMHRTSITRECMKYQNHVANAIKPSIFETPYIGQSAVKVQLEQARQKSLKLKEQLKELDDRIEMLQSVLEPLSTEHDMDIKYRIPVLVDLHQLRMEIHKCKENIATLEKNSGMIMKQVQLSALESLLQELASELDKLNRRAGNTEEHINNLTQQIAERQVDFSVQKGYYTESGLQAGDYLPSWNQEYEKQTGDKSFSQFKDNYSRRKKANLTTVDKLIDNMKDTMVKYKTAHDFGAAAAIEGYPEFEAEYVKLKNSELLQYEEKVESARQSAEEEFREQFLSKLQENMKTAQGEFKELNKALQDIVFSNEKYEFLFMPSKRYRQYYEMIMDDFNAMQGESIFSGVFHETHKAVIDELFERLALDNDNSSKALDEFTDYRTYMDYDIRIIHSDATYSLYSKVCEEKSGGETQTPFYVTVAASFVQLYKNNIGGESIGLVLFDEAFNNMDDERIGGVLEFLRRLPLQILIASPPDKIQYISPFIEETLLVMTDEKTSFVERYVNGAV